MIRFMGGLGNQMFQYALLRSLQARGRQVKGSLGFYRLHPELMQFCLTDVFRNVHIDFEEDNVFDEIYAHWRKIKEDEEKLKRFRENYTERFFWAEQEYGTYDSHVYDTSNCVFAGYWQTEKYFKHIRNDLLLEFCFPYGEEKYRRFREKFLNGDNYVSVHIRRGDYMAEPGVYGNLSLSGYYDRAMDYMRSRITNTVFVYFSDDMNWVKKHFSDKDGIYIEADLFEDYQMWYDMSLMSCCADHIIANSSFSWWGAWLNERNDKIVVAPEKWLYGHRTPDIWCDGWIKI